MALQQNPGFLSALGLNIDPEAIRKQQLQDRQALALNMAQSNNYRTSYEQQASNIGALLGARLAKGEGLTEDQKTKLAAQETAKVRMADWLKENQDASSAEKHEAFMKITSESAFAHGLSEIGAEAGAQYEDALKSRRAKELELAKLEYAPDQAAANLEQTKASTDLARGTGKLVPVWAHGASDPNSSTMAYIDPETHEAVNVKTGERVPPGEYTTNEPTRPDAFGRGGSRAGFGTLAEYGKVRDMFSGLYRRSQSMAGLKKILDESVDNSGTIAATGVAGRLAAGVSRWSNDLYNIMGLVAGGSAGEFTAVGKDGKAYSIDSTVGRRRFADQYADKIDSFLPPELIKAGELSDRWRSLVVELLYIEARSSEEGARQFSDADVERMAEQVGANVNNPEALRKILMSSYDRAYDRAFYTLSMYDPSVRGEIVNMDAIEALQKQREELYSQWKDTNWGSGHGGDTGELGTKNAPMSEEALLNKWGGQTD